MPVERRTLCNRTVIAQMAGFTLIEALVALAVMMLFISGVYGGIQLVSQVVYQSRLRIVQSAILSEQIEMIRNMSFFDIGIENGAPSGLLARTVTTSRNGIDFVITRTVRNIDDPFDGTIDAAPRIPPDGKVYICHNDSTLLVSESALDGHLGHGDTQGACDGDPEAGTFDQSPADYKFVEVSIICVACKQQEPLTMSTLIGPKFLEGNPENGALFVEVIDASGRPVQGATVQIISTSTDPTYNFEDTTGNDGMLRIVDLAPGQNAYHIVVSKDGYTTDMTTSTILNPIKPPASVVTQSVTSRTFTIDLVSTIQGNITNALCAEIPAVPVALTGERIIGTNPDTYMIQTQRVSSVLGGVMFTDIPWDSYTIVPNGYDLIGSIPMLPISLLPGSTVDVQLIIGANTAHSLLVHVQDNATGDPISLATVRLKKGVIEESVRTGIGTLRQHDWSQGAGQALYVDLAQYATDNGNVTADTDIRLVDVAGSYPTDGWLESSTFNLGGSTNFVSLQWSPIAQPIGVGTSSVRMQFASSNSSTPDVWNYLGPDGTSNSYYTIENQNIASIHNGDSYARYKVFMNTASTTLTPTISDIAFSYVSECTPPGQAYFGNLDESVYTVEISADGYAPYTSEISIIDDVRLIVSLTSA